MLGVGADHLPARRERPPPGTRAGAARDRGGDRAHPQRAARLDLARPAHAARRDGGRVVDAGRVRRADAARSAAGARPQRVRPVARAVRAGGQAAADDAPRDGAIKVERDWTSIADVADSAVRRLRERLAAHRLIVDMPGDLPLVRVDAALIEQALGNLLENAAKHTPPGTVVRLRAQADAAASWFCPSRITAATLADVDLERMFRKFQHGSMEGDGRRRRARARHLPRHRPAARRRLPGRSARRAAALTFRISLPLERRAGRCPPKPPDRMPSMEPAPDDPRRRGRARDPALPARRRWRPRAIGWRSPSTGPARSHRRRHAQA